MTDYYDNSSAARRARDKWNKWDRENNPEAYQSEDPQPEHMEQPSLQNATECYRTLVEEAQSDATKPPEPPNQPSQLPSPPEPCPADAWQKLSHQQELAINHLVVGRSDEAAAAMVGVHRVTVTRWRLYHPMFIAALNRRRQEIWSAAADRYRSLLSKACDIFEQQMLHGSEMDAFRVARAMLLHNNNRLLSPMDLPYNPTEVLDEFVRICRRSILDERTINDDDRRAAWEEMMRRAREDDPHGKNVPPHQPSDMPWIPDGHAPAD